MYNIYTNPCETTWSPIHPLIHHGIQTWPLTTHPLSPQYALFGCPRCCCCFVIISTTPYSTNKHTVVVGISRPVTRLPLGLIASVVVLVVDIAAAVTNFVYTFVFFKLHFCRCCCCCCIPTFLSPFGICLRKQNSREINENIENNKKGLVKYRRKKSCGIRNFRFCMW